MAQSWEKAGCIGGFPTPLDGGSVWVRINILLLLLFLHIPLIFGFVLKIFSLETDPNVGLEPHVMLVDSYIIVHGVDVACFKKMELFGKEKCV